MTSQSFSPSMIRRTLELIHVPGDVIEIRMPKAGRLKTVSGYFNAIDPLIQAVEPYTSQTAIPGIYFTLNPCNPALLARCAHQVHGYTDTTTADADIDRRVSFGIDFDPKRPAKISSTAPQHAAAITHAEQCRDWLSAMGWPDPLLADSGNGGHLVYGLTLPNDEDTKDLIGRVLKALELFRSTDDILVDTSVYNAARIWKLYGTMARKGSHVPDRPHRLAMILESPNILAPVSRDHLHTLAEMLPTVPPGRRPTFTTTAGPTIDAERWLSDHGLTVIGTKPWKDGATLYKLAVCPWNADHTANDACVIQWPNGMLGAQCFHHGCQGKGWRDLREQYEPRATRAKTRRAAATPTVEVVRDEDDPDRQEETASMQAEPPTDRYPCPDELWIGIYADVAQRLGKKSWEIWTGTTAALGATAERQIDVHYHGALYGMAYTLLVKPTGLGKSECTNTCRALLPDGYVARDSIQSGQALAPILADITRDKKDRVTQVIPRPAILIMDEWTALLHSAGIANSTIVDTINGLFHRKYPWNVSRSDRAGAGGDLVIHRPTLSICATTTVSLLKHCVNEHMIRSGFLNRHLVLPGTNGTWKFYQADAAGIDFDRLGGLLSPLRHRLWGHNKQSVWHSYTTAARERLVGWVEQAIEPIMNADSLNADAMKRLHVYAHILSLLYAWSDLKAAMIEVRHVDAAISVMAMSLQFVQSMLDAPDESDPPPFKRYEISIEQKIMALVRSTPGMTRRDVVRKLSGRSAKSGDINQIISQLVEMGRLTQTKARKSAGPGPSMLRLSVSD